MKIFGRLFRVFTCFVLLSTSLSLVFQTDSAYAAQITSRSLTLSSLTPTSDGGSKPLGVVNHQFSYTLPSATSIRSVRFEYCTSAVGSPLPTDCTAPVGMTAAAATLGTGTGIYTSGWTLNKTDIDSPFIVHAGIAGGAGTIILSSVTNPSAANTTFYVRIKTFTGADGITGPVDSGVVAASTATQIILTGTMPESLIFCAGATITANANIPDCSSATSGAVSFTTPFSPTVVSFANSQMAASTNAASGYSITVNGPTLSSGANTIATMPITGPSAISTSQFGLNLRLNTAPVAGAEVTLAPNGTNLRGQAVAATYGVQNSFRYVSGEAVAKSDNGGAGPTDAQIFTVTYIVNVPGSQAAGTYTTTITYICTATF